MPLKRLPHLRILTNRSHIRNHSLPPGLIIPINLILHRQNRHTQKVIPNLLRKIKHILLPANTPKPLRQKLHLLHIPPIILPGNRLLINPVMIREKIPHHTKPPGIQKHRDRNLHIFPQRHLIITEIHIPADQLSTKKLRHPGRLPGPPKKTPVIDQRGKQRLQIFPLINLLPKIRNLLPLRNPWVLKIKHQPADGQIRIHLKRQFQHPLIHIRINPVITVHKSHIITGSKLHPRLPGRSQPSVGLMNHADSSIAFSIRITDSPGTVPGTVIHQNNLKLLKSLSQNTIHTPAQIHFHIINRHNHTDLTAIVFHFHFSPAPKAFDKFRGTQETSDTQSPSAKETFRKASPVKAPDV